MSKIPLRLMLSATITQRRQTGPKDQYGKPTWEETPVTLDPDAVPPGGAHVQPVSSEEIVDRPEGRIAHRGFLSVPADVTIAATDRLVVPSIGFKAEIVGPVRQWRRPASTEVHHVEVDLVEVGSFTGGSS
jgi:hypothetical protein